MSDPAVNNALEIVPDQVEYLLKLCKEKHVAVQAGGWQGDAPLLLALHFDLVYTYEPAIENYGELVKSIDDQNIIPMFGLLSDKRGTGGVFKNKKNNSGDYRSKEGGAIPRYMIDDLGLEQCDLIWLDIQGDEWEALHGASRTIEEFHPVIGFEHSPKKCPQTHDVDQLLTSLGYEYVGHSHLDRFYT